MFAAQKFLMTGAAKLPTLVAMRHWTGNGAFITVDIPELAGRPNTSLLIRRGVAGEAYLSQEGGFGTTNYRLLAGSTAHTQNMLNHSTANGRARITMPASANTNGALWTLVVFSNGATASRVWPMDLQFVYAEETPTALVYFVKTENSTTKRYMATMGSGYMSFPDRTNSTDMSTAMSLVNGIQTVGANPGSGGFAIRDVPGVHRLDYTGTGAANNKIVLPWRPKIVMIARTANTVATPGTTNRQLVIATFTDNSGNEGGVLNGLGAGVNYSTTNRITRQDDGFTIVTSHADYNTNNMTYRALAIRDENQP